VVQNNAIITNAPQRLLIVCFAYSFFHRDPKGLIEDGSFLIMYLIKAPISTVFGSSHSNFLDLPSVALSPNNMSYPLRYSAWRRSAGTKAAKDQRLTIERTYDEELPQVLKPYEVVIKIHAVSLNYREIASLIGTYPMQLESRGVPCSDAAAEVIATGSAVSRFVIGDRVSPNTSIGDFEPDDDGIAVGIGFNAPGVLREYAVFQEKHLVPLPVHLSWEEVS
jgi:hypothetical protein